MAAKKKKSKSSVKSPVTKLLEAQHRKVEAIFNELEKGRLEPAPLLEELSNRLPAHMTIEQ